MGNGVGGVGVGYGGSSPHSVQKSIPSPRANNQGSSKNHLENCHFAKKSLIFLVFYMKRWPLFCQQICFSFSCFCKKISIFSYKIWCVPLALYPSP